MNDNSNHKKHPPGFTCPLTGFKFYFNKNFLICSLVMIVWMNLFSCLWHGIVMSDLYQQTAGLWRPFEEMLVSRLHLGITLMAIMSCYIFLKGYEGKGVKEGLRFGIIITIFFLGLGLITNATQPIPFEVIKMWVIGDLISYTIGGILIGFAYCKFDRSSKKSCNS